MPQIHQLIRCKRKSLALIVTAEAQLVIRAPWRLPEADIHNFIQKKRPWIERKIREVSSRPKPLVLSDEEKSEWRKLAGKRIPERAKYFIELTGFRPRSIKITGAKKRWGSCGAKGSINLSWRLILMPPQVVDYVIVHELVHLVERNHSKRFWSKVAEIMPGYHLQRRWLREFSLKF